jgi:hypothetical protein
MYPLIAGSTLAFLGWCRRQSSSASREASITHPPPSSRGGSLERFVPVGAAADDDADEKEAEEDEDEGEKGFWALQARQTRCSSSLTSEHDGHGHIILLFFKESCFRVNTVFKPLRS